MDKKLSRKHRKEQGQTVLLFALALIALLAMAAMAIDVVSLYGARSEAQRAANAAAIAGAKVFTTSGFTSVLVGGSVPSWSANACLAATAQAQAVAIQNTIAGKNVLVADVPVTCNFATPQNPRVTVVVNSHGLPVFFAKIWNRSTNSVSATASAEAYNPSGRLSPLLQVSVKPWLVPNCDVTKSAPPSDPNPNCPGPGNYPPFVNTNTAIHAQDGSVTNDGPAVGQVLTIGKVPHRAAVLLCVGGCAPPCTTPASCNTEYFPLDIPINPPAASCPACATGSDYSDNISCSTQYLMSCGQTVGLGGTASPPYGAVTIQNNNLNNLGLTATAATQCRIHASGIGAGQGQDVFSPGGGGQVTTIAPGPGNPNTNLGSATNISRSDSIITVPLYDGVPGGGPNRLNICPVGNGPCLKTATVVGFLQLGVMQSNANGSFDGVVLNIAGCSPPYPPASTPASPPTISGGGVSPVPVRLITLP